MANTTADKLTRLRDTKNAIKQAIINKGQTVSENDTFNSYATKINNIDTVDAQAKTVTPTTSQQIIEPDQNYNALSSVTVNAVTSAIDGNIQSDNIKSGVTILGVAGSQNVIDTSLASGVIPVYTVEGNFPFVLNTETGYYVGSGKLKDGSLVMTFDNDQTRDIVLSYKGSGLSGDGVVQVLLDDVVVDSLTDTNEYTNFIVADVFTGSHVIAVRVPSMMTTTTLEVKMVSNSEQGINQATVLNNRTGYVNGAKVTGTMADNGVLSYIPSTSSQVIPAGYTSGGSISAVTSSIDSNIQSDNIKSGVTILGVSGDSNVVDTTVGLTQTPADGIYLNSATGYYNWDSYYERGSLTTTINNTSGTNQTLVLQYKGTKVSGAESSNSISLDGVKQGALSNSINYTNYNITIPTGTHTVIYSMASGDGRTTFSGKFLSDEQAITTNTIISGYTGFVNGQKITGTAPADGGVSEALSQSY